MKTASFVKDSIKMLSPLEKDMLNKMKQGKKYGSTDLYRIISKKRKVGQSSVSVILDRLFKKGLLKRDAETAKGGIRFLYTVDIDREQFERKIVENTVNALIKRLGSNAITYFNESFKEKKRR